MGKAIFHDYATKRQIAAVKWKYQDSVSFRSEVLIEQGLY